MMRKIIELSFLFSFILFQVTLLAQAPKVKYGYVSMDELSMKSCSFDADAPALVLFDKGTLKHRYTDGHGFLIEYERHLRIKIFSKQALDMANLDVFYYKGQKVQDFKGCTYNLESGKIVETKLNGDNVFEEKLTDKIFLKKAVLPGVHEGSVIEFKYTITGDGIGLPLEKWVFQHPYAPTVWSEFEASIPAMIEYKKFFQGWTPFVIQEEKTDNERVSITYIDHGNSTSGFNVTAHSQSVNLEYTSNVLHYAQENVPALKPENFVASSNDYLSQISFDIRAVYDTDILPSGNAYKLVNSGFDRYNHTWATVGKDLWNDYFKDIIDSDKFTGSTASGLVSGKSAATDKMLAVYEYIGKNYQSQDLDRMWKSQTMDNLTKNRKGTPTDLNLLFINMLRRSDVAAYPVLISTRSHGHVLDFRVSTHQFNRIVSAVALEDSSLVLIDASAWPNPLGVLPVTSLNEKGFLLKSAENTSWIPLKGSVNDRIAILADLNVLADGQITGNVNFSETGHGAVEVRKGMSSKDPAVYFKEHFSSFSGDGQIKDVKVEEATSWNTSNVKGSFAVESASFATASGDKIYLTPLLGLGLKETPFKNPDRKFGVDFGPQESVNYVLTYKIPAGYKLEEAPASAKITMGENALGFEYIVDKSNPEQLKISVKKNIRTSFLPVEQYPELQQFYAAMVAKMSEKVVFSK